MDKRRDIKELTTRYLEEILNHQEKKKHGWQKGLFRARALFFDFVRMESGNFDKDEFMKWILDNIKALEKAEKIFVGKFRREIL